MLPPDYRSVLDAGVDALRRAEAELRRLASREGADPAIWLRVRDVSVLAGRLGESDDWLWQTGGASVEVTPPDLGVLASLAAAREGDSPYRDDSEAPGRRADARALRTLAAFLDRYLAGGFAFEDPNTYPPTGVGPPAI